MRVQGRMLPFRPLVAKATAPLAGTPVQPNSRVVKQRRHHHTDTDWEDQKQTVFRLYIEEDRSAEDVVEILARDFAFKASRRQFFKKSREWKFEKNRKRRREEEGEDPGFGSRGRPVPEDKIPRFAKRQTISAIAALASTEVPTPPSICYFTSVGDHDTMAPGQPTPQALPSTPSLLSPTNLLYMHASPAIEHLELSYNQPDMPDLRTPRLSPNCDTAGLLQTIRSPSRSQTAEPSTAVVVRTQSPTPFKVQLDNLPWFKFRVIFCTFLKAQRIDFCDRTTDYDPSLDHPTNCSDVYRGVSIMDSLRLRLSMPEESINLRYLLDLLGEHHGTDLGVIDESEFGPLVDILFTGWTSDSPVLDTEENTRTLYSYFRPFILERHDGELLEGAARILGPLYDGLLQFLNYTINLLSNNLLSESNVDKIVRWIDEIQGYELFAKLLSIKSSTIEALASNLLPSTLQLKNVRFTRILLDAGVNPNSPMGYQNTVPLQYIAKLGDTELVRILLDAGADVNAPPLQSHTALQVAAEKGNLEVVKVLLRAGANVNAPPSSFGCTTLQGAAKNENVELVQILLDTDANVNAPPPKYGSTALQAAAKNENIELVQILLRSSADVNAPPSHNNGYTALQAAAQTGNIELVRILLSAGADINAPPSRLDGHTALQAAAQTGNTELVQLLLNAGADINIPPQNASGWSCEYRPNGGTTLTKLSAGTTLQVAAWGGNIEVVQALLNAGADVNALPSRNGGRTALQAAAEKGNLELVKILLRASANINAPPSINYGRTVLQAAAENGNIELVEILLNAGANINAPPSINYGRTVLQAAAENGNIELIEILLNAGANINAPLSSNCGRTALQAAAQIGNIELVNILLNAGANINALPSQNWGRTALQAAAENGSLELVQMLLNAGANINAPPSINRGCTALQAAVENGSIELVEILLNAGGEVNAPPGRRFGITAIQAAAIRGNIRVALLLLNAGADVNAAPAIQDGRTALEGAAEHGRIDLVQLLIEAGADTNSSQCIRALKFAAKNGHDAVCGILNRSRKGDWISPAEARQMEEREDQFFFWDEEHDSDY